MNIRIPNSNNEVPFRVYYKEAVGAVVVYDVTRPVTFEAVRKWKQDLDENLRYCTLNNSPLLFMHRLTSILAPVFQLFYLQIK